MMLLLWKTLGHLRAYGLPCWGWGGRLHEDHNAAGIKGPSSPYLYSIYNPIPNFVICNISQAFGDTPDSSPNVRPGGIASQIIETVVIIHQSTTWRLMLLLWTFLGNLHNAHWKLCCHVSYKYFCKVPIIFLTADVREDEVLDEGGEAAALGGVRGQVPAHDVLYPLRGQDQQNWQSF